MRTPFALCLGGAKKELRSLEQICVMAVSVGTRLRCSLLGRSFHSEVLLINAHAQCAALLACSYPIGGSAF